MAKTERDQRERQSGDRGRKVIVRYLYRELLDELHYHDRNDRCECSKHRPFQTLANDGLTALEEAIDEHTGTGRNTCNKMIKIRLIENAEHIKPIHQSGKRSRKSGFRPELRDKRNKNESDRKDARRNV